MPIHEYKCKKCGHRFEELILGSAGADEVRCPKCAAKRAERLMSAFSTSGASKGKACNPAAGSGFS
jgi:putative FmdB family regulatory protein